MVDKVRRKNLAFHLRQLSVGLTTNDDFEAGIGEDITDGWLPEQYYRSKKAKYDDPVIIPMLELCWGLYDDTKRHKLTFSNKLSDEALKVIATCILFLHSGREYEWPHFNTLNPLFRFSLKDYAITMLTLGQHYRNKRKEHELAYAEFKNTGDHDVWPFLRKADFEKQLEKPPFLNYSGS